MADLMDRQAILKHIEKVRHGAQMMDDIRRASIIMNGMDLCEKAVMNQPTVDAVPVRRGKWILRGDSRKALYGWYFCSECGAFIGGKTNFCSECGADMRGERHDVI